MVPKISFFTISTTIAILLPIISWSSPLKVGDSPQLIASTHAGETFDLSKKRGKWVIVHFFSSWCPSCKTELPILDELFKKFHEKKLEMINLTPERKKNKSEIEKFINPFHLPYSFIADTKTNDFGEGTLLPSTFLIDPQGHLRKIYVPDGQPFSEKSIEEEMESSSSF